MVQHEKEAARRAGELLAHLHGLEKAQDRGALAALRRGLSSATEHYAYPLLAGWGADLEVGRERKIYLAVSGCWASHPETASQGNIGSTLRGAVGKWNKEKPYDPRFNGLLACRDAEALIDRLVPVVRLARSRGVAVNYRQLFVDLWCWGEEVKLAWAKEFWS